MTTTKRKGISAKRLAEDPAFERTRENISEFTRVANSTTLFQDSFQELINVHGDRSFTQRLRKAIWKVIQGDTTSMRGERNVETGATKELEKFRFNHGARFRRNFGTALITSIDRASGVLKADVAAVSPAEALGNRPFKATHYRLTIGGAAIGFNNEDMALQTARTELLPITKEPQAPLSLSVNLPANSTYPLFLVLGVSFYRLFNGVMLDLKSLSFNAMEVVAVSGKP